MREKRNGKIGTSMIVMLLLLILPLSAGIGFTSLSVSKGVLQESLSTANIELMQQIELNVESALDQAVGLTMFMARDRNFKLVNTQKVFESKVKDSLTNVVSDEITGAYYIIDDGETFATSTRFNDYKSNSWYSDASQLKENEYIITQAHKNDGHYVVDIVTPIYDYGNFEGVVGIELSLTSINDLLNGIKVGDTGFPMIITNDGELLTSKDESLIGMTVSNESFDEALAQKDHGSFEYNAEDGNRKFVVFSKVKAMPWTLIASMNLSEITSKSNGIRDAIVLLTVVACAVAITIGILFSRRLTKNVNGMIDLLGHVKNGDLTSNVESKQNNEFNIIANDINETVASIRTLLLDVNEGITQVSNASVELSSTADGTSKTAEELAYTIEDITRGAQDQASDAEQSATVARDLAEQFVTLRNTTNSMIELSKDVMVANEEGIKAVEDLSDKSSKADDANREIEEVIGRLAEKISSISELLNGISSIAEQTNLLALNASIEAARAGEHGRGFAVVADEIRKLAEDSQQLAQGIGSIVAEVSNESTRSVETVQMVKSLNDMQSESVSKVTNVFTQLSHEANKLVENIDETSNAIDIANDYKESMTSSIESISAVSEETAAATEEMTASVQEQTAAIDQVAQAAIHLNELAENLQKKISAFKL